MFFDLEIPSSKNMKVAQVLRLLKNDGWQLVRTRGSHRQFKHPEKCGLVTVSGKPSDDIQKGTLGNILRQAKLKQS
ncbi:MAG: type II toxin-antitoxin system HicA family toxin [Bacteroidales bacterium]|nr:type II toxin-antitoxin system HicA family toxin [Bacteroidales bacterium]